MRSSVHYREDRSSCISTIPSTRTLLERFAARLEALVSPDREILVAYVNPVHRGVFDRPARDQRLWDNSRVVVYRCRPAHETAA